MVLVMSDKEKTKEELINEISELRRWVAEQEAFKPHLVERELIHADKMISLGVLVSGVAHEINNPNSFIMLNAPLLQEAWESIAPILERYYQENGDFIVGGLPYSEMQDEVPKLFSGIVDGSRRINRIVQDLKNYSRGNDAEMDQVVNVNEVMRSAISLIANMIKKSTDKFSVRYGEDLPEIRGNVQKLEQVILNLIQNACQALADKEKAIGVSSSYDQSTGCILIEVQDEGIGIPEDILPRIMDPFFTTKRSYGGTGLGLSVSSNIVRDHGGRIAVESQRGKGATFTVFLPTTRAPARPPKILVVDDNDHLREIAVLVLRENSSYLVEGASSGAEACIKIGNDCPDLLILDVQMPDMNGVEVCRLIKKKPELSGIKVIVLTGYQNSPEVEALIEMGFKAIFSKPLSSAELLWIVDRVLKESHSTENPINTIDAGARR